MVESPAFLDTDSMPSNSSKMDFSSSPVISQLRELSLIKNTLPHSRFIATLGKNIDFSEAMSVSELLDDLSMSSTASLSENKASIEDKKSINNDLLEQLRQFYLQARGDMMNFIKNSFIIENCPVSLRLPLPTDEDFSREDRGLSSYQRFYSLHQSSMEASIIKLQHYCRRQVSNISKELSQLVTLETKIAAVLNDYARQSLSHIPLLLAKRFKILGIETRVHKAAIDPQPSSDSVKTHNTNLDRFLIEMQGLLLAELDTRLQPTLGLLEALAIEKEKNTP